MINSHWQKEKFVSDSSCFNMSYFSLSSRSFNNIVLSSYIIIIHTHELMLYLSLKEVNRMRPINVFTRLLTIFNWGRLIFIPYCVNSIFKPKISNSFTKTKDFTSSTNLCSLCLKEICMYKVVIFSRVQNLVRLSILMDLIIKSLSRL